MISIQTNLPSSLIARQLSSTKRQLRTNLERLSTGLRLNRPDDSPGQFGLVINQNLQIQALNQGIINVQNGAGMLQTAQEGINSLIEILNRAYSLAVTAADASLTPTQRQQAQDEVERLLTASDGSAEAQQILDNVNYNGLKLLAEGDKSAAIQSSSLGPVGGMREPTAQGGSKVELFTYVADATTSTNFRMNATTAVNQTALDKNSGNFTPVTLTANGSVLADTGIDLDGLKSGFNLNLSDGSKDNIKKGDILELSLTDSSGRTSDQVIVVAAVDVQNYTAAGVGDATYHQDYDQFTVINAQGYRSALNLYDSLVTDGVAPVLPSSQQPNSTGQVYNITDLVDSSDGLDAPVRLTIHNDQIYWTDRGTDKIQRSDLDGTNVTDLVTSADGLDFPYGLTIHNDQVYWADQNTDKIQRSDLDGSNVTDLVTSADGLNTPYGLTIHNDQIYWTDSGTDKIQRSDLDGSNVTDLVDSSAGLNSPLGLTIHNDQIYWADSGTKKVQRSDLDGSNVTDLVDSSAGLNSPYVLTIHNDQIYWMDTGTKKIQRSNLDGSNVTDLVTSADGLSGPRGLTIHNDQIYWIDYVTDKIRRADLLNPAILTNTTFSLQRIPQTLILDSTGATALTTSSRNFDPGTIASANSSQHEFRELLHLGVALQTSPHSGSARLYPVSLSFADTNPFSAAQKIQSAIEQQLGGQYRPGGTLHIDVTPLADVYKIETTSISNGHDTTKADLIARLAEITPQRWTSTTTLIGDGSYASFSGLPVIGLEYVDATNVYFKFSTTTTAGVRQRPELRLMSDVLSGYAGSQYANRLFGNSLSITRGQHGNDKFILTIDGEEVEVDLDGDSASSSAKRIDALISEVEAQTLNVSSSAALEAPISRLGLTQIRPLYFSAVNAAHTDAGVAHGTTWGIEGIRATSGLTTQASAYNGGTINATPFSGGATYVQTSMLSTAGSNFAPSDATLGNGYDLGQANSRNYSGGYYSPDNLRTMLTQAINRATISAAEVSVSYDHSTRSLTFTTTSHGNLSSLKIGRSVASNITLDGAGGWATSLIDTTPGTSGFIGALGLSQDAASQGAGSFFEFRLGGEGQIFSLQFSTMGLTNMGADQVDISNLNLSTPGGAASAIASIENALDSISSSQTRIGSGINHMRRRIEIMESQKDALSGSKSRVEEIDFTVESRKLASLQMLLQSSTAALAQANIIPQTLLQLLA